MDGIVEITPIATVRSPCVNVCAIDPTTGWCTGCWRSLDEIAAWTAINDAARRAILAKLPDRRHVASVG